MFEMNKIFLIIFVFQYINADDSESDEKYIDLLPEEEKQGFLNRIARRISEGVKSTDIPNESHAEVNEDQLDAQNAYVKQLIKEESKILENEKRDNILRNYQETDNKGGKNSDDEPHIDLTLRAQSREERNGSKINEYLDKTNELKVIPVLTDQENLNNSAIKSKENVDIKAIRDKNITIKIEKGQKSELTRANDSKSAENIHIIRKSYEKSSTTISNFDPSSEENNSATEDEITVSQSTINPDYTYNGNTTETDSGIIWISTKKIYDTESNENINSESAETISTLSTLSTLTYEEQATSPSLINSTLETEKNTQEITTSKTTENNSNFNQTRNKKTRNKHLYVRSGDIDLKNYSNITVITTDNISDLKTNKNYTEPVNKIINDTISDTNNATSDVRSIYLDNNNKENITDLKPKESKISDTNNATSDVRSIYLDNNNKENITDLKPKESHISLRATESRESELNVQEQNLKPDTNVYEVFEVAADKPPFVMKSDVETKETPYYFPVYNYAPDHAYFRPRTRFEPNTDNTDEDNKDNFVTYKNSNEESPNTRSKFSGYNKKEKTLHGNIPGRYIMKQQNENIFDFIRPIKINNVQDIYYNPNDYLDMDYYFGRTYVNPLRNSNVESEDVEEGFPNTNEEDHPYISIHSSDSVKDHIRAVRKLLYLKHIYEPLQEIKKKELRKYYDKRIQRQNNDTKYKKRDQLRYNNVDNIAIDYYFGIVPNNKAVQGVTIDKPNNNQLLRNPEKKKEKKTNEYDQLNESKFISTNELNTTLDKVLESILNVLRDFIRFDNQGLSGYNWLESTVDIRAAIKKLLELMKSLHFQENIHPKDLELLKYVLYLYKSSVNTIKTQKVDVNTMKETNRKGVKDRETGKRIKNIMPKNKWNNKIREPVKLWLEVSSYLRNGNKTKERLKLLFDFEDFLQNLMFSLHDFHDAIKHIAMITKYNNQRWYEDLKNIYLHNVTNEKLLTLLLHVSATKLLNSIEKSANDGVESNFKNYIINNKQYVKRSKEEFLFVLNILHELRRMNKN